MAVTKEQVLACLQGIKSPEGIPLPDTGTLSDVVATDGKVFFSISVDAAQVKAWEAVRERAEKAVRALPGVQSALVALTAERKAGASPERPPPAGARPAPREVDPRMSAYPIHSRIRAMISPSLCSLTSTATPWLR